MQLSASRIAQATLAFLHWYLNTMRAQMQKDAARLEIQGVWGVGL